MLVLAIFLLLAAPWSSTALFLNNQHAGFNHDGHIEWRDCGPADKWVTMTNFDLGPKPLVVPGDVHVTFLASNSHELSNSATLNVTIEKGLLGRWTPVPCTGDLGTCFYDDPCHFLNVFAGDSCPQGFIDAGLPCACPFNPAPEITLNDYVVNVANINPAYTWLANGKFHVKVEILERTTNHLKGCVEAYLDIHRN